MITNFEQITSDLTPEERKLIPILIDGFNRKTKKNPVKERDIVRAINEKKEKYGLQKRFTGVRLRKLCNVIRSRGMLPLIATSEGYYVSYNRPDIEKQILSMQERASRILNACKGLKTFLA